MTAESVPVLKLMFVAMRQRLQLLHSQAGTWRPKSQRAQRRQVPACMHLAANNLFCRSERLLTQISNPKAARLASCDGANSELADRAVTGAPEAFPNSLGDPEGQSGSVCTAG